MVVSCFQVLEQFGLVVKMKFYLYESKENVDWIMECEGTTMCHIHGVFIPSYEQDFLTDKRPWES